MPKINGKDVPQETYCRSCAVNWFGACNVFLRDDEDDCGDRVPFLLIPAAEKALAKLKAIQAAEDPDPLPMPWPEIDELERALDELDALR